MDALILSCSTGGGHNAAGAAIKEELIARGHHAEMMDPYTLVSRKLAAEIGDVYVKLVQRTPRVFGMAYSAGNLIRHVPGKSPVYYANIQVAKKLEDYLASHHFDVVIMPHLFPAELITYLKRRNVPLPVSVFVATDYVCIPFTEETDCDYYIVPGEGQVRDFVKRGIPREKILPFGIPVSGIFWQDISKEEARELLGLEQEKQYFLLTGGSIGAGALQKAIRILLKYIRTKEIDGKLIVVCGNNKRLYKKLAFRYGRKLVLIEKTKQMALYMKACDLFLSKPGGLSSTEAAVAQVPYIHLTPIPGCESKNMRYFSKNGMSISVKNLYLQLGRAVTRLQLPEQRDKMRECQRKGIPERSLERICDWLLQLER